MTKLEAKLKCDVLKSEEQRPPQIYAKVPAAISVLVTDTFNNYLVRDRAADVGLGLTALRASKFF